MRKQLRIWGAVLFCGMFLWGCANSDEVKIGVIIPQEGSLGDYGFQIISGIEMAEEELKTLKAQGKIKKNYRIVYENESADPNKVDVALESFNRLKKSGVTAIIGAASSSATLALVPHANREQILLMSPASSSPEINKEGGDFVFRNYPSDTLEAQALSNVIFQKCRLQKVLMVRAKNAYAEGITFELLRFARKNSSSLPDHVVKFESDPTTVDFASVVDQIIVDAPDAVFLGSYTDALIPLIKEIRSRDELKRTYVFTSSSFLPSKVVKALGPELVENVIFTGYEWDPTSSPERSDFAKEFDAKFGTEATIYAATGYDALMILKAAIEEANHRLPNETKTEMNKLVYEGLLGETDFNKRGDVTRIPVVYWMKGGVPTPLTVEDMEEIKREFLTRVD